MVEDPSVILATSLNPPLHATVPAARSAHDGALLRHYAVNTPSGICLICSGLARLGKKKTLGRTGEGPSAISKWPALGGKRPVGHIHATGEMREHPYNPTPTLQFLCAAKING
jgi:hypothetical protein